ncbi:MAG: hypothetical protein ACRCX2_28920 [Paraclostridium sp.]
MNKDEKIFLDNIMKPTCDKEFFNHLSKKLKELSIIMANVDTKDEERFVASFGAGATKAMCEVLLEKSKELEAEYEREKTGRVDK